MNACITLSAIMNSVKQFVRRKSGGLFSYRDVITDDQIVHRIDCVIFKKYDNTGDTNDLAAYLLSIDSELVPQCIPGQMLCLKMYPEEGKTYTNVINCDGTITNRGVAFWFSSHPDIIEYIKEKKPENLEIINVGDNEKIYIILPKEGANMINTVFLIVGNNGKVFQI